MLMDKVAIRALIPHAGSMCLLDAVLDWDEASIRCSTATHRDPCHPLRRDGRLAAVHAFEYGAQAAAIHGALLARSSAQPRYDGYLGALRNGRLTVTHLHTIGENLEVSAHLLFGDRGNAIYYCLVAAAGQSLAEARITIIERPAVDPCAI